MIQRYRPRFIGLLNVVSPKHSCFSLLVALAGLMAGCTLSPRGLDEETAKLKAKGTAFAERFESRDIPELPAEPTWEDVLQQAFLANGDLEAAYYEWQAAVERVRIASAYPNTNITLGYSYAFSAENMKSFDRMTFSGGFDSMENLAFPGKVKKAGEIALSEARAAGETFRAKKFNLQREVLTAWTDYALLSETLRIQSEQTELAKFLADTAETRLTTGGNQSDLLRAEIALKTAEDKTQTLEAEREAARATLNALLARQADAPLVAPKSITPRLSSIDDQTLLAAAAENNPELAALSQQVQRRGDALELARLQWIPDINPSVVFTGGIAQAVGAAVVLPTTVAKIQGGIRDADSMLRAAEGILRQATHDRTSRYVAALIMLRNSERQSKLFQEQIIPAAENILKTTQSAYSTGSSTYLDLIESQRALLESRQMLVEALAMREKKLAEIEALAGVDLETVINESETVPCSPNS